MNERPGMFRMIVRHDNVEAVSDGGIILNATQDSFESSVKASDIGTIVSMGPACFNVARCGDEGHPEVGDRIRFKQYTGYGFSQDENGSAIHYSIINDDDFLTIIEESDK